MPACRWLVMAGGRSRAQNRILVSLVEISLGTYSFVPEKRLLLDLIVGVVGSTSLIHAWLVKEIHKYILCLNESRQDMVLSSMRGVMSRWTAVPTTWYTQEAKGEQKFYACVSCWKMGHALGICATCFQNERPGTPTFSSRIFEDRVKIPRWFHGTMLLSMNSWRGQWRERCFYLSTYLSI